MADLNYRTQDVSLRDDDTGNSMVINVDGELQTRDDDAIAGLSEIIEHTKDIHHYQEMGEAFYATYTATLTTKDTQYPIVYMVNPSGSGKDVEIQHVDISAVSIGAGTYAKMRMYTNPTVTANGTAITQVNAKVGNINTSGINVYSVPTVTANGSLMLYQASTMVAPFRDEHVLGTGIVENNAILFTLEATSNGTSVQITIKYASYTD